MTQDEIIEMAVKAGIAQAVAEVNIDIMEAFAKLVADKEREACAKICDDELKQWGIFDSDVGDVSKAIRARGYQKGQTD